MKLFVIPNIFHLDQPSADCWFNVLLLDKENLFILLTNDEQIGNFLQTYASPFPCKLLQTVCFHED